MKWKDFININYNLKKDIALKDYFRNSLNFSDFFNGAIFHGKQVIDSKFLKTSDTEVSTFNENQIKTFEKRKKMETWACSLDSQVVGEGGSWDVCGAW